MADSKLADEYMRRAEDARREAQRVASPAIKEGVLQVAKEYERMAEAVGDSSR
jgi:hypothetical protein